MGRAGSRCSSPTRLRFWSGRKRNDCRLPVNGASLQPRVIEHCSAQERDVPRAEALRIAKNFRADGRGTRKKSGFVTAKLAYGRLSASAHWLHVGASATAVAGQR